MRRKRLLTAALCTVLALASVTVGSTFDNRIQISHMTPQWPSVALAAEEKSDGEDSGKTEKSKEKKSQKPDGESPSSEGAKEETPASPAAETPVTETPKTEESAPPSTEPPKQEESDPPATEAPKPQETPAATETEKPSEATETQPPSEIVTERPTEAEQLPSETLPTEVQTETGTPTTEVTPGETLPTETETGSTEKATESKTEKESETEEESETGTNEELIARQNIVIPPDIKLEFRFTQVEKRYAVVSSRSGAKVYEEKSADAREVGELEYYGCCCILEDKGDGWYYVESGNVRGFLASEAVVSGETAERIVKIKGLQELPEAHLLVARTENEAFSYTHTTTQEVMAEKEYALAKEAVTIYEQRKDSSRAIGKLAEQSLCYILADEEKEWVFVESGDARGFVKKSSLLTGDPAQKKVEEKGEQNIALAEVLVEPEENKSCYYTFTSVKKASQAALTREAMVKFALQFVGNPYVWGGTSLTGGADCSGFVQSVYANFGYSLPRVAENQAVYGMQIPVESAEPGDLIFYARNGYVYHVSMYIGNGQVVHAAGRKVGIITSGIDGNAVWATRIITD